MFGTQNNDSTSNAISYIAPKNKTMAQKVSINNRISCVVVISIFGFNKYWQTLFNLMGLNMSPTPKQSFQSKTVNSEKNKAYYQQYDEKK